MKMRRLIAMTFFSCIFSAQNSCGLINSNSSERDADASVAETSLSVSDEQADSLGLTQKATCTKSCNGVRYKLGGCWKHDGEFFALKCVDGGKSIEQWFGNCENKSIRGVCVAWQRWTIKR